jgi:hypothetical protein
LKSCGSRFARQSPALPASYRSHANAHLHTKDSEPTPASHPKPLLEPTPHGPNHSITQPLNHSISQSLNLSISQSLNRSISQSLNHSISQSLNLSISQSGKVCLRPAPATATATPASRPTPVPFLTMIRIKRSLLRAIALRTRPLGFGLPGVPNLPPRRCEGLERTCAPASPPS